MARNTSDQSRTELELISRKSKTSLPCLDLSLACPPRSFDMRRLTLIGSLTCQYGREREKREPIVASDLAGNYRERSPIWTCSVESRRTASAASCSGVRD